MSKPTPNIDLTRLLHRAADLWAQHGAKMLQRTDQWRHADDSLLIRPDDGSDARTDETRRLIRSDDDRRDRMWSVQAAGYYSELTVLVERMENDARRLKRLHEIILPAQGKRSSVAPLTQRAELVSLGLCVSCHRDNEYAEPVWENRSKDGCQWCTKWRQSEGQWPPVALVRWRHRNPGRALTTADVARLLGKAS